MPPWKDAASSGYKIIVNLPVKAVRAEDLWVEAVAGARVCYLENTLMIRDSFCSTLTASPAALPCPSTSRLEVEYLHSSAAANVVTCDSKYFSSRQ